jgi:RNA polymerase sigma-70 factor (ECF subfamily)
MTRSDDAAADIVQEVFINIWNKRETLVNVVNPSSYFFTAVYRRVYHYYRKIALEKKLLQCVPVVKQSVNTTEEMVIAHESSSLISQAIAKLPPQQQLVFKLSKQEGLSREDVASELKISPNTVKNHLSNATSFIRAFLDNSRVTSILIMWFVNFF